MNEQSTAQGAERVAPVGARVDAGERLVAWIQRLARQRDLQGICEVVRSAARDLAGADGATFILREGEQCHYVDEDAIEPLWKGRRFPLGVCISGWAMLEQQALAIEDVYADPRIPAEAYRPTFVRSLAMVPVRTAAPVAAIGVYWAVRRRAGEEVMRLLQALADSTSVALENVELVRELREARAAAEETSRIKDEFLGAVSHELRTPLSTIVGWSSLILRKGLTPAELRRAAEVIQRCAKVQVRLVDDLLDASRVVSGRMQVERAVLDLAPVVDAALAEVAGAADQKRIRLRGRIEPGCRVRGDAVRLQQALRNLLLNAIRFTPAGGHVGVTLESDEGHARMAVEDDGQGIEPAVLPVLFERFRQAEGSLGRRAPGLGLGLTLVRSIARLHGGSVTAHSEGVGRGSRFVLELPLHLTALQEEDLEAPEEPVDLRGLKVLVVDDDPDAQELVGRLLAEWGVVVRCAASAAEALDALGAERPQVLISDLGMPGEDGLALIRRVRAAERSGGGAPLPAVALTAHARPEDRDQALAAGFDRHVAKPAEPGRLRAELALLARNRA